MFATCFVEVCLTCFNSYRLPFILIIYGVVCLRCFLHHILLLTAYTFRENRECVLVIIVQFMMSAYSRIHFGLKIVFVYWYITPSQYHHCANLSEDIELIKCVSDIFCRVCEQDKAYPFSFPFYYLCGAVFFQFTHFPCDHWENIYTFEDLVIKWML